MVNRVLAVMKRREMDVEDQLLINVLQPSDSETLPQFEHGTVRLMA